MDATGCFSLTYREARERFLHASREQQAAEESYVHPTLKGPAGEDLAMDVVVIGSHTCGRVLMVVSGTHGVEGHAGSACQTHFLRSGFCTETAPSTCVVLVHAVNPYGFAYSRRTNEDNVDLNRNFVDFSQPLPHNSNYAQYAREFLPSGNTADDYQQARARLQREAEARGGYGFFKKAMQPGQYDFPDGLYYGGTRPSWSRTVFLRICDRLFAGARRVAVLDLHTGLGAPGVGELIFMSREDGTRYGQLFTPPVSCAGKQDSVSASVKGPLVSAARDQVDAEMAICCALEFGTVSLHENVEAKIFENWAHHSLAPDDPLRRDSARRMRDAYFCDNSVWKTKVIERATEAVATLRDCLSAA